MRKLARLEKITSLSPIEGADKIELATVVGLPVVVKKGEFKEGEFVVYFKSISDEYLLKKESK